MVDVRVALSGIRIGLMLTSLHGNVIRIFAGDFTAGQMGGKAATPMPILIVVLLLLIPYPAIKWITLAAATFLFIFNAVSLPSPRAQLLSAALGMTSSLPRCVLWPNLRLL